MTKSQGRSAESNTQTAVGSSGGQLNNAPVPGSNVPVPNNPPVMDFNEPEPSNPLVPDFDVPGPSNPPLQNRNAPARNLNAPILNYLANNLRIPKYNVPWPNYNVQVPNYYKFLGLKGYADMIRELIENNLTKDEMADVLMSQRSINPKITKIAWNHMEESNPGYFQPYYTRLTLLRRITNLPGQLQGAPAESVASNFPAPPAIGTSGNNSNDPGSPKSVGNIARANNNSSGAEENLELQAPQRDSSSTDRHSTTAADERHYCQEAAFQEALNFLCKI